MRCLTIRARSRGSALDCPFRPAGRRVETSDATQVGVLAGVPGGRVHDGRRRARADLGHRAGDRRGFAGGRAVGHAVVVVRDGRIVSVGRAGEVQVPVGARARRFLRPTNLLDLRSAR